MLPRGLTFLQRIDAEQQPRRPETERAENTRRQAHEHTQHTRKQSHRQRAILLHLWRVVVDVVLWRHRADASRTTSPHPTCRPPSGERRTVSRPPGRRGGPSANCDENVVVCCAQHLNASATTIDHYPRSSATYCRGTER